MSTLVFGGTSFLGRALVRLLREEQPSGGLYLTRLPDTPLLCGFPRENQLELDIRDAAAVRAVLERLRPEVIFNFAGKNSVAEAWLHPDETVDVNVNGTVNILQAVHLLDLHTRVIIAGSGEEYGRRSIGEMPLKESLPAVPVNVYAATKACQTMMAKVFARAYGMDVLLVRTFNELGPELEETFAVPAFCLQFARMEAGLCERVLRVGNVNVKRDFTDVRDIARAFHCVSRSGRAGQVYNAGRGRAVSVREVIAILEKETGIHPELLCEESRVRPLDIPMVEADCSLIREDTGWEPEISLEESIRDMLNAFRAKCR